MPAPLELRMYLRRITMDELEAGVQPMKQNGKLYHPPVLQFRYLQKINGSVSWSEWQNVGYEREE